MAINLFRGIAFPFQRGDTGFPAAAVDDTLIGDSLRQLVLTPRGSRVMRPDFGTNIMAYVFENNDEILSEVIRSEIMAAIGKYEPRVIVRAIRVTRQDTKVFAEIRYVVRATRREGTTVVAV